MKNLKFLVGVAALVSMGLIGFVACDETTDEQQQDCSPTCSVGQICVATAAGPKCAVDNACSRAGKICTDAQTCNVATATCETPQVVYKDYKYVRIDDLSKQYTEADLRREEDPGADIDTVVLIKTNNSLVYPKDVAGYQYGEIPQGDDLYSERKYARDPEKVKELDAFTNYPNNVESCALHKGSSEGPYTYVSLGGIGGWLIVEMGDKIEIGDKIDVLEVGGCEITNSSASGDAIKDNIKVQVSVAADASSQWQLIATGEGPVVSSPALTADHLPKRQ
ncbi:MAG: hypothetical protein ACOX8U_09455 [Bradymonadia bacterium]|jgi:hypothetical protein